MHRGFKDVRSVNNFFLDVSANLSGILFLRQILKIPINFVRLNPRILRKAAKLR